MSTVPPSAESNRNFVDACEAVDAAMQKIMSTAPPAAEPGRKLNDACKNVEAAMRTIIETLPALELNDAVSLMPQVATLQQVRRDIATSKAFG